MVQPDDWQKLSDYRYTVFQKHSILLCYGMFNYREKQDGLLLPTAPYLKFKSDMKNNRTDFKIFEFILIQQMIYIIGSFPEKCNSMHLQADLFS